MQNNVQNYTHVEKRKIKPWTMEEIHKVQLLFENKRRIKEIARVVDRSESAVNKFLSRSGIRKAITLSIVLAINAGAMENAGWRLDNLRLDNLQWADQVRYYEEQLEAALRDKDEMIADKNELAHQVYLTADELRAAKEKIKTLQEAYFKDKNEQDNTDYEREHEAAGEARWQLEEKDKKLEEKDKELAKKDEEIARQAAEIADLKKKLARK